MSAQNIGVLVLMCALLLSIPYFISVYKHVRFEEEVRADMAIKSEKVSSGVACKRVFKYASKSACACQQVQHISVQASTQVNFSVYAC